MRDSTSDVVIGKIAAEQLMARLEKLEISQRALIFASIGLGMPVSQLATELDVPVDEVRAQIREGLAMLRADDDLQHLLAGIRKVGDHADFHGHIYRLRLESWFCRQCRRFQIQKGRGRPRITCSDNCRRNRHDALKTSTH